MTPPATSDAVEQATDWDRVWEERDVVEEDLDAELRSLRSRVQRELVVRRFGSFEGLEAVEVGAGQATNALLYAKQGARVTVLDNSPVALDQAKARFDREGLDVRLVEADAFELPEELRGSFDVSMSFGLCEHFLGHRRQLIVRSHIDLVKPGGVAVINVPNRLSPFYRAWMGLHKRRGTWTLGTEVPFSGSEMTDLAKLAGGVPLRPVYIGGLGTLLNHGVYVWLQRFGIKTPPVPQVQVPLLDYLAYELLVPIVRP